MHRGRSITFLKSPKASEIPERQTSTTWADKKPGKGFKRSIHSFKTVALKWGRLSPRGNLQCWRHLDCHDSVGATGM